MHVWITPPLKNTPVYIQLCSEFSKSSPYCPGILWAMKFVNKFLSIHVENFKFVDKLNFFVSLHQKIIEVLYFFFFEDWWTPTRLVILGTAHLFSLTYSYPFIFIKAWRLHKKHDLICMQWSWILIYNINCYDLNHCKFYSKSLSP